MLGEGRCASPICKINPGATHLLPLEATARNSARLRKISSLWFAATKSGRQLFAALRSATSQNLAAAYSSHTRAKSVTALADQLTGLIGTFHFFSFKRGCFIRSWESGVNEYAKRLKNHSMCLKSRHFLPIPAQETKSAIRKLLCFQCVECLWITWHVLCWFSKERFRQGGHFI